MVINWVLEREVFNDNHDRLAEAAKTVGHKVISWDDFWWENGKWPTLEGQCTVFHGSLGNAHRIASELPWRPGSFCNTSAFACHAWYEGAKNYLLHKRWVYSTVAELIVSPEAVLKGIGLPNSFFVRPDSPLKPFSGRVIKQEELSFEALDYGFYYDDKNLPIVITPVSDVGVEWRFVIAGTKVVASSNYEASNRSETDCECPTEVFEFANEFVNNIIPPDSVYVFDLCKNKEDIRLVEMNPFSGADLYACNRENIVSAIEAILELARANKRV
jgi:ATP-grasp domain, R2K clade family 3